MAAKGQRIGYVRVSSYDQNADRQLEPLAADRVFTDKASGKDTERPQLQALLQYAREGDTIVVHSMDRLARNLDDLRRLVLGQTKRGVRIQFIKENLTFTAEESPMANLLLSVMGAFAEFDRALIKERQREGITLARQRGAYLGRRKSLPPEKVAELRRRSDGGEKKAALAREFGISRETLYQYIRGKDNRPAIRFWAPSPVTDFEGYDRMRRFSEKTPLLQELLNQHGVLEADISPLMPTDHPDGTHYHVSLKAPKAIDSKARAALRDAIREMLALEGNVGSSTDTSHLPQLMAGYGFSPFKGFGQGIVTNI